VTDIAKWLADLGLAKYASAFAAHEVDFGALQQLSEADLETLGLPLGPRRKVMAALAAHDEPMAPAAPPPSRGEAERRQRLFVPISPPSRRRPTCELPRRSSMRFDRDFAATPSEC
jgi:hypothetical protein